MTSGLFDLDACFLTELFEFAISIKQGGLPSLPFLQGYKLVHAWWLADLGYLSEAQRYCEAIAGAVKGYTKGSPYLHRQLLESLREFGELCEATSGQGISGDTGSWLKNKLSKNSLDSLWGSLEGKFNKFVSGEDIPTEEPPPRKSTEIMANPYDIAKEGPPARSASAFDFRIGRSSVGPESLRRAATPTASMASEGYGNRRSSSPGSRIASTFTHAFTPLSDTMGETASRGAAAPVTATGEAIAKSNQMPARKYDGDGYAGYGYGSRPANATMSPFGQRETVSSSYSPAQGYDSQLNEQQQSTYSDSWYGGQQTQYGSTGTQQYEAPSGYEPVSGAAQYEPVSTTATAAAHNYVDDDDDLGLGNSSRKQKASGEAAGAATPGAAVESETHIPEKTQAEESKKENEHDEKKADEGKGWRIFSLFHRSSSSTATPEKKAVKANLGESSTFYYDEKEKRWVNKNPLLSRAHPHHRLGVQYNHQHHHQLILVLLLDRLAVLQ
ncbi:Sec23-binding domain of Sec16-domain-containing protein [Dichotomocladium elegans]|nr:Sec23-binding domain of Sec16-domain-containing protein [Dichotomocladium elegans]